MFDISWEYDSSVTHGQIDFVIAIVAAEMLR